MKRLVLLGFVSLFVLGVGARATEASTITYNLTVSGCSNSCGSVPFGSVTLTDIAVGNVAVNVSLFNGNKFVNTGFAGSFGFNLIGNPTIAVTGLPSSFSLLSTTAGTSSFSALRRFEYVIVCCNGNNGAGNAVAGPLTFNVLATGLTIAKFAERSTNAHGNGGTAAYFVADIISGQTGNTGPVGATSACDNCAPVPEPASLVLLGSGLVGAVAVVRRRRTHA